MPRYAWPRNAARCSRSWCLRPRPQAQGRPCSHRIQRRYIRLPRDPNEARHNDGCTSRLHRHAIQGRQPGRLDYALPHGVAYHRRAYGYIHRGPDSASVTEHLCPILGKLQGAGCAHGRQRGREHEEPLRSYRGEHSASAAEPERVSKSHLLASSRGFPADMTPAVPFTLEMVFDPICLIVFSPLVVLWESWHKLGGAACWLQACSGYIPGALYSVYVRGLAQGREHAFWIVGGWCTIEPISSTRSLANVISLNNGCSSLISQNVQVVPQEVGWGVGCWR